MTLLIALSALAIVMTVAAGIMHPPTPYSAEI